MRSIFTLLLAIIALYSYSQSTITANVNGSWNNSSTWSPTRVPTDGDIVVIPAGVTVKFIGTPYSQSNPATRPQLRINIYGTLDFSDPGNDKLYLDYGSVIQIYNGGKILTTTSSTEIIAIYTGSGTVDNTVWNGTPATVTGPQFASATTTSFSTGVLPIKLKSFTAQVQNNRVVLNWSTAEEINTSHFVVEKSVNARNWSSIQTVAAKGEAADYTAQDAETATGEVFYRLKSVDQDGKTQYSHIVRIVSNGAQSTYVSPNPASGSVTVSLSSAATAPLQLQLIASNGQVLKEALFAKGSTLLRVGVSGITPGVYTLVLRSGASLVEASQLVIQ